MPRSILVAVDGSSQALAAWQAAVELADCFAAQLTALHVVVPRPRSSLETSLDAARRAEEAARHHGAQVLEEVRALAGSLVMSTELLFGDPADVICARAEELGVDLIVLGRRGLNPVDQILLGSVSTEVARRAHCSVLLVRAD